MVAEVVRFLVEESPRRGTVVDMTLGAGGHTEALLRAGVDRVIGIDRDPAALASGGRAARRVHGDRFRAVQTTFEHVDEGVTDGPVDGVLYDLGVSSMQLDRPERGFSYREDGPLDMRMARRRRRRAVGRRPGQHPAGSRARRRHLRARGRAPFAPHRARDRRVAARSTAPISSRA